MDPPAFKAAMRRIVTGEGPDGRSMIILDGPPSQILGPESQSGLFEVWSERLTEMMDPRDGKDRGRQAGALSPGPGVVGVRWFVVDPIPETAPPERARAAARGFFESIGALHELSDQDRHPAMHRTDTIDIVCLISGKASLVLDDAETPLSPGQVVIQRGASHAWTAHDGPALFLAVLIGRDLAASVT